MTTATSSTDRPTVQGPRAPVAAGAPSTDGDATWDSDGGRDGTFRDGVAPRWLGRDGRGGPTTFLGTAHGPRLLESLRG